MEYLHRVNRIGVIARRHALDLAIVLLALESAIELVARQDSRTHRRRRCGSPIPATDGSAARAPPTPALPVRRPRGLLAGRPDAVVCRRQPRHVRDEHFIAGMIASFLLGNLRDALQARIGLGIAVGAAAVVVYNQPSHSTGELVFIPLLFGICWLAGYALEAREEQAEAAEVRATQAERDREAAARIAVAEERARIARELHDIVAHAVSVMVLQVGVVRHKLPGSSPRRRTRCAASSRPAAPHWRRCAGSSARCGARARRPSSPRSRASSGSTRSPRRSAARGCPCALHVEGEPVRLPRAIDLSAYRIVQEGLTNALKHAHAGHADVTVRYGTGRAAARGARRRSRERERRRPRPRARGHPRAGQDLRRRDDGRPGGGGGFVLSTRLPLEAEPA